MSTSPFAVDLVCGIHRTELGAESRGAAVKDLATCRTRGLAGPEGPRHLQGTSSEFDMVTETGSEFDMITGTGSEFDMITGTGSEVDMIVGTGSEFDMITETGSEFDMKTETDSEFDMIAGTGSEFDMKLLVKHNKFCIN
ncbi:hypothetical protein V6N12_014506 [Hibiscus sabdariffa]|uniref:Uncharacterized protein n=1 Tax=Hibiscus sabdariffa TaxID=183260 RepID=A0ABR2DKE3_9ROSI